MKKTELSNINNQLDSISHYFLYGNTSSAVTRLELLLSSKETIDFKPLINQLSSMSIHRREFTLVMSAIKKCTRTVDFLLTDCQWIDNYPSSNKYTLLKAAIRSSNLSLIKLLVEKYHFNKDTEVTTLDMLTIAADYASTETALYFLSVIDFNISSAEHQDIVLIAAGRGKTRLFDALIASQINDAGVMDKAICPLITKSFVTAYMYGIDHNRLAHFIRYIEFRLRKDEKLYQHWMLDFNNNFLAGGNVETCANNLLSSVRTNLYNNHCSISDRLGETLSSYRRYKNLHRHWEAMFSLNSDKNKALLIALSYLKKTFTVGLSKIIIKLLLTIKCSVHNAEYLFPDYFLSLNGNKHALLKGCEQEKDLIKTLFDQLQLLSKNDINGYKASIENARELKYFTLECLYGLDFLHALCSRFKTTLPVSIASLSQPLEKKKVAWDSSNPLINTERHQRFKNYKFFALSDSQYQQAGQQWMEVLAKELDSSYQP